MNWKGLTMAVLLAGAAAPAAAQPAPDPTGDWISTVQVGAVSVRAALHLGAASSSFDSPDRGALGLPAKMTRSGPHVSVAIDKIGVFEGDLSADGKTLTGALKQGPASTPMVLSRGVFAAARRPQTPLKPYPYREEEAGYPNPAHPNVHLAGTLTLPNGVEPFPAVLLITGSGAQDRDETILEHKPFLVLADALTRRGIAVLRVDDRGMGGSTGASPNDTTFDFAMDVEAGVGWLKARKDIDPRRIGLIGHSEGGVIAPMVAGKDPQVAFIVLWNGPAVKGADIIAEQVRALNLAAGAPAAAADNAGKLQAKVLAALLTSSDPAASRAAVSKVMTDAGLPPVSDQAFAVLNSPWYRTYVAYDPAPALRALRIPVLAVVGGKDTQVTAAQNLPVLKAALAGDAKAEVVELPGLNHMLQPATTGGVEEYGKIETTIDPAALKLIAEWVAKAAGRP
jgi:pimeloyl-ACP methyl ester carboxylesterase